MKRFAKVLGLASLGVTFASPILFMNQHLGEAAMKTLLLAATVVWFATAPLWMKTSD